MKLRNLNILKKKRDFNKLNQMKIDFNIFFYPVVHIVFQFIVLRKRKPKSKTLLLPFS